MEILKIEIKINYRIKTFKNHKSQFDFCKFLFKNVQYKFFLLET